MKNKTELIVDIDGDSLKIVKTPSRIFVNTYILDIYINEKLVYRNLHSYPLESGKKTGTALKIMSDKIKEDKQNA